MYILSKYAKRKKCHSELRSPKYAQATNYHSSDLDISFHANEIIKHYPKQEKFYSSIHNDRNFC